MYIIKYGRLYISWVNYEEYEFGVDIKDKAKTFATESEILELHKHLGLGNIEIEKL